MRRQLPGLYWDDEKQRYFPRAHRPTTDAHQTQRQPTPTRRRTPLADLRSVLHTAHRDALIHQIQSSQLAFTHQLTRSTVGGASVSAFQSVSHNGEAYNCFAGDTLGWFRSSVLGDEWVPQYYLCSEVSSISVSDAACVATSFGPECRILYAPLDLSAVVVQKIDSRVLHDVWTADLQGSRLVLGANQQAVMVEDIAVSTSLQRLPTHSDVLALAQHDDILYAGLRNGGILRFDTRLPRSSSHSLFSQRTASITGLKHLRDYRLVVSFIDGRISTFDLRFPTQTPSMVFTGNFNQYTVTLPLVTDPYEKFLFAAGQDNRIRLWSLLTGGQPLDPGGTYQSVFQQPFSHRVAALQVVEERQGMYLWAASGTEVYKYGLGYRAGICT